MLLSFIRGGLELDATSFVGHLVLEGASFEGISGGLFRGPGGPEIQPDLCEGEGPPEWFRWEVRASTLNCQTSVANADHVMDRAVLQLKTATTSSSRSQARRLEARFAFWERWGDVELLDPLWRVAIQVLYEDGEKTHTAWKKVPPLVMDLPGWNPRQLARARVSHFTGRPMPPLRGESRVESRFDREPPV